MAVFPCFDQWHVFVTAVFESGMEPKAEGFKEQSILDVEDQTGPFWPYSDNLRKVVYRIALCVIHAYDAKRH